MHFAKIVSSALDALVRGCQEKRKVNAMSQKRSRRSAYFASSPLWPVDASHGLAPDRSDVGNMNDSRGIRRWHSALILLILITAANGEDNHVDVRCAAEPDCGTESSYVWCEQHAEGSSPKPGCTCWNGIPHSCLPCTSAESIYDYCSSWCRGYKPCPPAVEQVATASEQSGEAYRLALAISIPCFIIVCMVVIAIVAKHYRRHRLAASGCQSGSPCGWLRCSMWKNIKPRIDHPFGTQEQGAPSRTSADRNSLPATATGVTDAAAEDPLIVSR